MDAFDLMSDFEDDHAPIDVDKQVEAANDHIQTDKIEKSRSMNENTSGKEMTVPSSDVKNENSNGDDFFHKNSQNNILGKRTFNQVSQCLLSPTIRDDHQKNESNSEKGRQSDHDDDLDSQKSGDSSDKRSRKNRLRNKLSAPATPSQGLHKTNYSFRNHQQSMGLQQTSFDKGPLKQDAGSYMKALNSQSLQKRQNTQMSNADKIQQVQYLQMQQQKMVALQLQQQAQATGQTPQNILMIAQLQQQQLQQKVASIQLIQGQLMQISEQYKQNESNLTDQQKELIKLKVQQLQTQLTQLQNDPQVVNYLKEVQLANIQKQKSLNQNQEQSDNKVVNFKEELEKMNEQKQKSEGHHSNQDFNGSFINQKKINSGGANGGVSYDNQPKLTPAQIHNRKYSIYIKNFSIISDQKFSDETEIVKNQLREVLQQFGEVNNISIDGSRKSAIIRFKQVDTAGTVYHHFREIDPETGRRRRILGESHPEAQIVYVIPEVSTAQEKDLHQQDENYDACKDPNLTLDQITKLIDDQGLNVKETMKEFFSAEANSDKKKELEDKLNQLKQRLKDLIEKKREITKAFAINKQKEQRQFRYNSEHHSPAKPNHSKEVNFQGSQTSQIYVNPRDKPQNEKYVHQGPPVVKSKLFQSVELVLDGIVSTPEKDYQKIGTLISHIKQFGEPSDCKFMNKEKTEAYIKFKCIYDMETVDEMIVALNSCSDNLYTAKKKV